MGVLTQLERIEQAHKNGKTWRLPIDAIDPNAIDDIVAYTRNVSSRKFEVYGLDLMVEGATGQVRLVRGTGPPTGGGAVVVPVNDNGSNVVPGVSDLTFETDPDITNIVETFITGYSLLQDTSLSVIFPVGMRMIDGGGIGLAMSIATSILSGAILLMEAPEDN